PPDGAPHQLVEEALALGEAAEKLGQPVRRIGHLEGGRKAGFEFGIGPHLLLSMHGRNDAQPVAWVSGHRLPAPPRSPPARPASPSSRDRSAATAPRVPPLPPRENRLRDSRDRHAPVADGRGSGSAA